MEKERVELPRCCRNCKYGVPFVGGDVKAQTVKRGGEVEVEGGFKDLYVECHRYPPASHGKQTYHLVENRPPLVNFDLWPRLGPGDRCGEFAYGDQNCVPIPVAPGGKSLEVGE